MHFDLWTLFTRWDPGDGTGGGDRETGDRGAPAFYRTPLLSGPQESQESQESQENLCI